MPMLLNVGDFAPWFIPPTQAHEFPRDAQSESDRIVLFFFGSSRNAQVNQALKKFCTLQKQFEQHNASFFGVSIDPNDQKLESLVDKTARFRFLWDFDGDISIQYGLCHLNNNDIAYDPTTFVLDRNLRIQAIFPVDAAVRHVDQVIHFISSSSAPAPLTLVNQQAPVLLVPHVFPPDFCQHLINLYEADGGKDSGFMKQTGDKTIEMLDPKLKQRRDFVVKDSALIGQINQFIWRRIKPEIEKAFHFNVTCFERYLVACYEAETQGFFSAHRDNVTQGTMHRRFAMTLNLTTGSYEGGHLCFPEYGNSLYRPGIGEAVIFSCSLLHEARPVTRGRRFTLLSFFYNDDDAKVREQNLKHVVLRQQK